VDSGRKGYVYQAHSKKVKDQSIAIKLTPSNKISDMEGWKTELKKVSKLSLIGGVVHYHMHGTADISHAHQTQLVLFTVWDYIPPGRNLEGYLSENKNNIRVSFLVSVIENILLVLHACKIKGVEQHGDLHSRNILIGEADDANLDPATLKPREPVYVSDFGYGVTGGRVKPKDDYSGLAQIAEEIILAIEFKLLTSEDRHILMKVREIFGKILKEQIVSERVSPIEIIKQIRKITKSARLKAGSSDSRQRSSYTFESDSAKELDHLNVGQFQISEMLGEKWNWWNKLFVSNVPARSRILATDIPTVVTGPRGCGKTMLFRRLSQRLMIECGPLEGEFNDNKFVGFYVNANAIGDAFPRFPKKPSQKDEKRLTCYLNLCVLSDFLDVQQSRIAKLGEEYSSNLLITLDKWFSKSISSSDILPQENPLAHHRATLESLKWEFLKSELPPTFSGFSDFAQISSLSELIRFARQSCKWIGNASVFLFIDDYTTPRVSESMQKVLNRTLFNRSSEYVCKVATEAATTFIPEDLSGKILQDGDDYKLIDMAEESLFMKEAERALFLDEVFKRRLSEDQRIPAKGQELEGLLGTLGMSKTAFARLIRKEPLSDSIIIRKPNSHSQRRGASKPTVLYHGKDVFVSLWSGDTRMMVQLMQELIDVSIHSQFSKVKPPIEDELQDRIFRETGGAWLQAQARDMPTHPDLVKSEMRKLNDFQLAGGSYGTHLKAIVEAFVASARQMLLGPVYRIKKREVPRMAFRIEILDDFRVEGLARHLYSDLIRYGLFMRDARGKSVKGAMVPRLYIRRLLLPYCTLALSKRDAVPMSCEWFVKMLLYPDKFKIEFANLLKSRLKDSPNQSKLPFGNDFEQDELEPPEPLYDDLSEDNDE
tara:strand:+ start:3340 stop:5988 length:2649 start_codon:yes stop_codon:yes gene_type:complete